MTALASASEFAPNWWALGLVFVVCFLGVIVIAARSGRTSTATLHDRMKRAEQDELVAAHRRAARDALNHPTD